MAFISNKKPCWQVEGFPIVALDQSVRVLKLEAHAKINLYLDVLNQREDGYHEIQTLMQSVELSDELRIISQSSTIEICCDHPSLASSPQDNLAFKAFKLLKDKTRTNRGAKIELKKNIPVGAGLAGGSADAAATLVGLNILWGLNLSLTELQELAAELGSDIPFCLEGGTLLAEGRGERLRKVSQFPEAFIIIAKPNFPLSTAKIYEQYDRMKGNANSDISKILRALEAGDLEEICSCLANALEEAVFKDYPQVKVVKEKFLEAGALGALMSGSGPSVFAIAETQEKALEISQAMEELTPLMITVPFRSGVEIV